LAMDIKSNIGRKLGSFANKVKNMNPRIRPGARIKDGRMVKGTPVANSVGGGRRRRKKRTKKKARKKRRKSKRRR